MLLADQAREERYPQPDPEPHREVVDSPFGAVVVRQLSVWPFAPRPTRLFLLVDPSLPGHSFRRGLLRAMQQAYFRSDGASQTRSVREAAFAAHYVLRHHNRDLLPLDQVNAATAVAAMRGETAFVALAGDAAALAWRDGALTGQRGVLRLARPLGLEQDPRITLWSTPLDPNDRLILVCGATWRPDTWAVIEEVMRSANANSLDEPEQRLAEALSGSRPAGVLIVNPRGESRRKRHLYLVPPADRDAPRSLETQARPRPRHRSVKSVLRLLMTLIGLALLAGAGAAVIDPSLQAQRLSTVNQAQGLLAQAEQTTDRAQAHALAASALDIVQRADAEAPGRYADMIAQAGQKLNTIDHVTPVSPAMVVQLGPSGRNVVDLAVGDNALYTLDVVESSIRTFALDGRDQQPSPDTVLVRAGAAIGPSQHRLAVPVAIEYVPGASPDQGVLAIVDQGRSVVQVGRDRTLSMRPLASSAGWRELGALGSDADGHLFVLDSGSRQLLEYPPFSQAASEPPRLVLDATSAPGLAFEHAAEIVGAGDRLVLRMEDGSLRSYDRDGTEQPIAIQPPDGQLASVSGIAPDRRGGLYLADPTHARVLHTTADGVLLEQLRDPSLAGLREIQSSLDGRRLYGLVAAGVTVIDLPSDLPANDPDPGN